MKGFYCLMAGLNVSEDLANVLMYTAVAMIKNNKQARCDFKLPTAEGVIRTTYKYSLLGTIGGFEFSAEVESDIGTREVRYIVRDDFEGIEHGRWYSMSLFDLLEMQAQEGSDPPSTALNLYPPQGEPLRASANTLGRCFLFMVKRIPQGDDFLWGIFCAQRLRA